MTDLQTFSIIVGITILAFGRTKLGLFGIFLLFGYSQATYVATLMREHTWLCGYFAVVLVATVPLIVVVGRRNVGNLIKVIRIRKLFHLVTVIMFGPKFVWESPTRREFVGMVAIVVLGILIICEKLRLSGWNVFNKIVGPFIDQKETKHTFITSHIQLLVAVLFPIWLSEIWSISLFTQPLFLLSGILTIGIGDSAAAVGGLAMRNPHRLPGTRKTLQGFASFVFSVVLVIWVYGYVSVRAILATTVAGIAECYTKRLDNIVVPLAFSATLFACSTLL